MSGTLAVVTVYRGRECVSAGYDLDEAESLAEAAAEMGGWEQGPVIRDLLPELEERFPLGGQVRLGRPVYWRRGQHGTVTAGEPASYARWSPGNPAPWFIGTDGADVFVTLDDGYASWWPAKWLETRLLEVRA
jgi:hypothetical protein